MTEVDDAVARLAAEQHGAVARWQLRPLGADRFWVRRRVAAGRMQVATDRVLLVPGAPGTPEQSLMIGVLDAGPGAAASHRSAAWLWRLPGYRRPGCEVVRPRPPGVPRSNASLHRPVLWLPEHRTVVRDVPAWSLPLVLFQLASVEPLGRMAVVVDRVITRSPAVLPALHRLLPVVARRGVPGITVMRTLLGERPVGSGVPPTGNERRFELLLHQAGEPPLERQVDVGGDVWIGRCDYRCRETGLLVEVQSELFHDSVTDRARDARRAAALLAAGHPKVLFIWEDQLWQRPWEVAPAVRAARAELRARAHPVLGAETLRLPQRSRTENDEISRPAGPGPG